MAEICRKVIWLKDRLNEDQSPAGNCGDLLALVCRAGHVSFTSFG